MPASRHFTEATPWEPRSRRGTVARQRQYRSKMNGIKKYFADRCRGSCCHVRASQWSTMAATLTTPANPHNRFHRRQNRWTRPGHGDHQPRRPSDAIDVAQEPAYHAGMTVIRLAALVLGVIHALFVGLTSLAGAFADGGDAWQRLLVVFLHPLGAAGVLLLVLVPRLSRTAIVGIAAVLLANVIADLVLAQKIAAGAASGDWELGLVFAAVPSVALAYAMIRLGPGRRAAG